MATRLSLTFYSDVLCIWAFVAQVRCAELQQEFGDRISISYRFCSVFGDTANKIGEGWRERGGYEGYGRHVRDAIAPFDHVELHPEIWQRDRPASSTPGHLLLKAVQRVDNQRCETVLHELRRAFFERCQDVGRWSVLRGVLEQCDVSVDAVREAIDSGAAYADLEADRRDQQLLMIQGSPTFILNDGRQKLFGNVGYGVIEANIKELLRSPVAGAASWC